MTSAKTRCGHDSGSATGNRPLCDDRATQQITYRLVGMGVDVTVKRCDRHAKYVAYHAMSECTTVAV